MSRWPKPHHSSIDKSDIRLILKINRLPIDDDVGYIYIRLRHARR